MADKKLSCLNRPVLRSKEASTESIPIERVGILFLKPSKFCLDKNYISAPVESWKSQVWKLVDAKNFCFHFIGMALRIS